MTPSRGVSNVLHRYDTTRSADLKTHHLQCLFEFPPILFKGLAARVSEMQQRLRHLSTIGLQHLDVTSLLQSREMARQRALVHLCLVLQIKEVGPVDGEQERNNHEPPRFVNHSINLSERLSLPVHWPPLLELVYGEDRAKN